MKRTIFVVGAGSGCGNHVAQKFGENDFRVVLMARSQEHLAQYENEFQDMRIEVHTRTVDAADTASVETAFADLKREFGIPDVLFYNVGIKIPDAELGEPVDAALMTERYRTDVCGAYTAIQQVLGPEFSEKKGAVLVTGGGLALYPMYAFLPLSMDKAALRAMCLALHEELKAQDVYVGTLTVTGAIAPDSKWDPKLLADDFWKMYTERTEAEVVR